MKTKYRELFFLVIPLIFFAFNSLWAEHWVSCRSLNVPRAGLVCEAVNGKIYAIGGRDERRVLGVCEEYNPQQDTWVIKRPMPTPRYGAVSAVWENKIYVIGGDTSISSPSPVNIIEIYDPGRDTWMRANTFLPTPRSGAGGSRLAHLIFVIGGCQRRGNITDTVEVYDVRENRWLIKRSMITPRSNFSVVATSSRIYALGGLYYGPIAQCEVFNESTNNWRAIRPLPSARHSTAACAYGEIVFVIGGSGMHPNEIRKRVDYYIPERDTWQRYPNLNYGRHSLGACLLRDELYAIGGVDSAGRCVKRVEKSQVLGVGIKREERSEKIRGKEFPTYFRAEKRLMINEPHSIFDALGNKINSGNLRSGLYFIHLKRENRVKKLIVY